LSLHATLLEQDLLKVLNRKQINYNLQRFKESHTPLEVILIL
jgi:hypothetical protein